MSVNKTYFSMIAVVIVVSLLIGACAANMPNWYMNPSKSDDTIYGVGVSEKTESIQLGRDVAVANARTDLAGKIQVSVQSMLRTFLQQSGTMEESRALQFAESVGKQVVNVTLTGSNVTRTEMRKGRYFAEVEISMESINNAIHTAARNAAAEFSELKAKSALEDLDKAIDKLNLQQ